MGYLHKGHLSLVRHARAENELLVASIFVNPTQFAPHEDLERYPRDVPRDLQLLEAAGVDSVFIPTVAEIYPSSFVTYVEPTGPLAEQAEGARRPGHFRGVATVVLKLFQLVLPHQAYFGQKDAQQATVIRKLVRDLNLSVDVRVCPTVRESSGLAMSSRNAYLSAEERERAAAISRALAAAEQLVGEGERDAQHVLAAASAVLQRAGIDAEYLELRSAEDLSPVERVNGSTLLAVAARVGRARLIDNTVVSAPRTVSGARPRTGEPSDPRSARVGESRRACRSPSPGGFPRHNAYRVRRRGLRLGDLAPCLRHRVRRPEKLLQQAHGHPFNALTACPSPTSRPGPRRCARSATWWC